MKYLITIILTALVVGFGVTAYFKGWLPTVTFNKPEAASVQNVEVSDKTPEPVISPSPIASSSATPQAKNDEDILPEIKLAMVAKNGADFSDLSYKLSKIEGNYASGTVNGQGGGGMWFAAKVNGSWVIVADGNGVILCSSLIPYPNFPKSMIPECWDSTTNKIVKR